MDHLSTFSVHQHAQPTLEDAGEKKTFNNPSVLISKLEELEEKLIFFYKNSFKIPPSAVDDDIITLLECGHKTNAMIAYIEQKQCKQQ